MPDILTFMRFLFVCFPLFICGAALGQNAPDFLKELKTAKEDSNKVLLYGNIATSYQFEQPDSATHYINAGIELADKIDYPRGKALLKGKLGAVNEIHGNFKAAKEHLLEGLEISKEINDVNTTAKLTNSLGVVEGKKGNLKEATTYFLKALKLYQSEKDTLGIVQTYIKLGVVNELNNELDKALSYYTTAQKIDNTTRASNSSLTLLNNMGIVYAKKGDLQKALQYFEEAIKRTDSPKDIALHITLLDNAGNAYDHLNQKDKALSYHQQALAKARQFDLPEYEARALLNIAALYSAKDAGAAKRVLDSALSVSTRIQHAMLTSEIYMAIVSYYKEQGDYKNALNSLEHYHAIKDSFFSAERTRDIARLQANYELEESKVQIKDLELRNQAATFQRNVGIISAIGILAVLFIGVFYWRRTKKLNKELQESNEVKDKLFSIIGHDLRGPIGGIAQMLELLDEGDFTEEEKKEIITELRKQGQISFEILNSMLSWGKTQLQGARVNIVEFHPKSIISKNIEVLRAQAQDKGIVVNDRTDTYVKAFADPDHFDFVIRNLLSNAIKFTPSKGRIDIDAVPGNDRTVTFSVSDNGIGISKEKQRQFATSNLNLTLGTNGEKGNGIGLLLSKEFIEANKGRMWIESEEGKGTTFNFTLPQRATANTIIKTPQ